MKHASIEKWLPKLQSQKVMKKNKAGDWLRWLIAEERRLANDQCGVKCVSFQTSRYDTGLILFAKIHIKKTDVCPNIFSPVNYLLQRKTTVKL